MHVLLGLLGAVVTILYLLDRLGIDLGGLNPFYWRRRRAWAKQYHGDPIHSVEDPIQVAALLIVGAAKLNGDLTAEQKQTAIAQFEETFSLNSREASELLTSATHLLGAPQVIDTQLEGLIARHKDRFTPDQAASIMLMIARVTSADGEPSEQQNEFIADLRSHLRFAETKEGPWAE
jgi:hypothetical protein